MADSPLPDRLVNPFAPSVKSSDRVATRPPSPSRDPEAFRMWSYKQSEDKNKRMADYHERSKGLTVYDAIAPPPDSNLCGGVAPCLITDSLRACLIPLCNLALDKFHSDNPGANYVFENIVKTTGRATSGTTYYITFEARAVAASTSQTFQAHVWDRHPDLGGPVVEECKLKQPLT